MQTAPIDPRRRPLLTVGGAYVLAHVATIAAVAAWYGRDVEGLVAAGGTSLPYALLVTGFAIVLVATCGRSLPRRWTVGGAAALLALVAVRSAVPVAAGLLTVIVVFAIVLLPVVVLTAVTARIVVVRLPWKRIAEIPDRRGTIGVAFLCGVLLLATVGGSVVAAAAAPPAVPPADWVAERQLAYLERTDQADRRTGAFVDGRRDYRRATRVLALLTADRVNTPAAALDAAVVLQHGTCPEHFEIGHRLATTAAAAGVEGADRWARLTHDRWQRSLGNPQEHGTQVGSASAGGACAPVVPSALDPADPLGDAAGVAAAGSENQFRGLTEE
jgi:hypothetical protein